MFEARREYDWSHTSSVMALIANVNRDPDKCDPFEPDEFNPLCQPDPPDRGPRLTVEMIAPAFVRAPES